MASELEKPMITEIKVRMDCNGCVQKIKKALHGLHGIHDLYIDYPNQKLTIIGWADPEKIVKAIRKTRKTATICSHTEQQTENNAPETEQSPETSQQESTDAANPPQAEPEPSGQPPEVLAQPPEAVAPPSEPPQETPRPEKQSQELPTSANTENSAANHTEPSGHKDVGEVHVIYRYPPDYGHAYGYGNSKASRWEKYSNNQGYPHRPPDRDTLGQGFPHELPHHYAHSPRFPEEPPIHSPRYRHEPTARYVNINQGFLHEPPARYPEGSQSVPHEPPSRYVESSQGFPNEQPITYVNSNQRFPHESEVRYANVQGIPHEPPPHRHTTQEQPQPVRYPHESQVRYANVQGVPHETPPRRYTPQEQPQPVRFPHGSQDRFPNGQGFPHETSPYRYTYREGNTQEQSQPDYVSHGYNTYRPSPYVTEYEQTHSPARYMHYGRRGHYTDDYQSNQYSGNGSITAMFSDENPNACLIM